VGRRGQPVGEEGVERGAGGWSFGWAGTCLSGALPARLRRRHRRGPRRYVVTTLSRLQVWIKTIQVGEYYIFRLDVFSLYDQLD